MSLSLIFATALAVAQSPIAALGCQIALGPLYEGTGEARLQGQLDGATLAGRDAVLALRRERGETLITVRGDNFSGAGFGEILRVPAGGAQARRLLADADAAE